MTNCNVGAGNCVQNVQWITPCLLVPFNSLFDRKQAFEAALLAQTWKVKYEDIKWPKNKGKLGSRKSMVSLFYLIISCTVFYISMMKDHTRKCYFDKQMFAKKSLTRKLDANRLMIVVISKAQVFIIDTVQMSLSADCFLCCPKFILIMTGYFF